MTLPQEVSLPRLSTPDRGALSSIIHHDLDAIRDQSINLSHAHFHPFGDRAVQKQELLEWRTELNAWAYDHGFPQKLNEARKNEWDVALGTRLLKDTAGLAEQKNPQAWCWIATYLLPHFVAYRWEWPATDTDDRPTGRDPWARFGSSQKNGLLLARNRIETYGPDIARRATEQEFQSIQNRPAFGIDQRVSRLVLQTLVDAWDDPDSNYGRRGGNRSLDADNVCVLVRRENSLRPLCFMNDESVAGVVSGIIRNLPDNRIRWPETTDNTNGNDEVD